MEIRYLLQMLRANWLFITLVSLVAGLLGLSATYVLPENFEATTQILIRPQERAAFDESKTKAMMDYPLGFNIPVGTISQTYAEIMTSEAIATKVEDRLQLHTIETPWPDDFWMSLLFTVRDYAKLAIFSTWDFIRFGRIEPQLDPYWKTVKDIREGLEADPVQDTYIFTLTASWSDPDIAVKIADTAAETFVQYSREARTREEGTSAGYLASTLDDTSTALSEARAELDYYRERIGAANLEQELQLTLDSLSDFEKELEDAERKRSELDAEVVSLKALLSGKSAARTLRGDARTATEARLADRIASRDAVDTRVASLQETVERYRSRSAELGSYQSRLAQLGLDVGLLEDSYRMIAHEYEESRIATAQDVTEIRVLHPAVRPRYPTGPIKVYYAGGALALGVLLSLGLVLLVDYADHRVRSTEEIEDSLGVPVIASLPHTALPSGSTEVLGHDASLAWGPRTEGRADAPEVDDDV
jgi:uncharacterized protein involved in exopolysaccharide biosynthesis